MELFKSRTRVAYTNAVGDKVYPVVVDIKKGIKSTEDIQFVSSDVNTGILSVAFISGNENFNVSGADVICSVMRPDASTLELPCEVVRENIVEVPLGINGTSQDGVYSFDFKVLKGGNKVVGTPIMNYSVSLSIGNDMVVDEDDRLPILTMLMTQVNELKEETRGTINQANAATVASREATANAIEATNNANAVSERVSQETSTAISEIKQDTANAIASMNQSTTDAISTMNQSATDAIADMTQKTDEAVTMVNNNLVNINNVVTTKVAELDNAKSDMTNTVSNKVNEVESRFNALTSKQQQDAEVIDARDGETSLKVRLDRDIEKAKQVYVNVEGSHISTDSSSGYLKDLEIFGNTIQNASNLADIRSVGDKVEGQELYEIPVLSCGKNLISSEFEHGELNFNTGENSNNSVNTLIRTKNYIAVDGNRDIVFSNEGLYLNAWFIAYDKDYKYIKTFENVNKFTTPANCKYIRFRTRKTNGVDVIDLSTVSSYKIQLEYGTQATPYEPYVEDKLTILSPVQLEKVGDVADRIIEKNGVWGVEKNITTKLFDGSESTITGVSLEGNKLNYRLCYSRKKVLNNVTDSGKLMSNKFECFLYSSTTNNVTVPSFRFIYTTSELYCVVPVTEFTEHPSTQTFKEKVASYGTYVKYPTTQPQFIPLPHDQQIKLRTFASKTNISFGCEIEGKIKAQVPKSIGATVNTHTEQIRSLNNELNRVKKLEESTVSTVETESDFTTVEATSNGYFEDVKLEGKTLVSKCSAKTITKNIEALYSYVFITPFKVEIGKTYTIVGNVKSPTKNVVDLKYKESNTYMVSLKNTFAYTFTATRNETLALVSLETGKYVITDLMLLEGDHTQNPPNGYIEGLKSVGQSATTSEDDVDEIVVSSVKGDGNLFDGTLEVGSLNASGDTNWNSYVKTGLIRVKPSSEVICKIGKYKGETATSTDIRMAEYDMNKNFIKFSGGTYKATVSDKTHYVKFAKKLEASDDSRVDINAVSDVVVVYGNELHDIPHQSDKKRLLYYNTETQAWEKPILREWDSIEKHIDGKYYYHVRSIEEDYVEGDESVSNYITDMTTTVKPLAQEKVYECTNIDLITYANETNFIVESGVLSPKTTLKVHNNISNVVNILQEKVSLLENKFIEGLKKVLAGDMYSLAELLYPEDFVEEIPENEIMILPFE